MLFRLFSCCLASAFAAATASAQGQLASLWTHNNSVMGLFADGPMRIFRYEQPREGMREEGVTKGTILFKGTKSGDTYAGTVYVFSRRCGAIPYSVRGNVSSDSRQVTLTGAAPSRLDSDCQPAAYRDDVLSFEFVRALGAPADVASASPPKLPSASLTQPVGRATSRYVQEEVCTPVVRDALGAASKEAMQKLERSLTASCQRCFDEGAKKNFAREELAALDLILSDRTASLTPEVVMQTRAKYDRLFKSCSDTLVAKLVEELARKH